MSEVAGVGVGAMPEGGRVDFARLREDRRRRLFDAMAAADVDALLLGRPANVAFASGARQLWTAGTRPFSPGCVLLADGERIHLLSTWDEGVPAEIPHSQLFGLSWNPAVSLDRLRSIPGLNRCLRVATDGWGATSRGLVGSLCPDSEVVDGGPLLRRARSAKSPDELVCLMTACAVAERALTDLTGALAAGVTERELVGVYAASVAGSGLPCPPTEGVAWVSSAATGSGRPRRVATDRPLAEGDLVALNPGALYAGYEATIGRTRQVGRGPDGRVREAILANRALLDAVIGACRPGAVGADLLDTWRANGGGQLYEPLLWGLGLGVEPPVIGAVGLGSDSAVGLGSDSAIRSGAVLAVQAWTVEPGVGGVLEQEVVLVGPEGPTVLSRAQSGL